MKKQNKQNAPQQSRPSGSGKTSLVVKENGGEPTASRAEMPVLLIALLAGLIYWGNMYVVEFGGQLDARVQGPYKNFKQIVDYVPKDGPDPVAAGLAVYNKICVGCHQGDGNGSTSQNAPPLAGSEWVLSKDPARIARIVLHGLSGPIKVKDKEWGAAQMLAFKDVLSDQEIADVLSYIRNTWGNKAPVVKLEQVKKAREETKDHSGYMTVEDLMKVSVQE